MRRYNICIKNLKRKYSETNIGEYSEESYERSAEKKQNEKNSSAPVAPHICCVSDKSRSGNSQIAKRTGIRIHVDDDGNVNTYMRNDVPTRSVGTHLRASRYAPTRYTQYVPTKMRIHFLQNVSHSAAHYRRNEKGMIRGGNSDKEDTSRTKKRKEKERTVEGEKGKSGAEEGKGTRRGRTKGGRERRAWTFRETRKNATPPRHDRNIFVFTKLCIPRASAISLKA